MVCLPSLRLPLTSLSEISPLVNLSVEARAHLSKFIRHALAENDPSSFSETQREAWTLALEDVHRELGGCIAAGEWLNAKKLRKRRKPRNDQVERTKLEKGKGSFRGNLNSTGKAQAQASASEHSEQEMSQSYASTRSTRTGNSVYDPGLALNQLRVLVSKQPLRSSSPSEFHLLLSIAPRESQIPTEDSGFDIVPLNPSCQFKTDIFFLPDVNTDGQPTSGIILYGLEEWDGDHSSPIEDAVQLVGGTFYLRGISSPEQHDALFKVLRLSIYVHLSLILEQHFLANSSIEIRFPKPDQPPQDSPLPLSPSTDPPLPPLPPAKLKRRRSLISSSLLSFLTKTGGNLVQRAASIRPVRRKDSLAPESGDKPSRGPSEEERNPRRLRRFSLIPDRLAASKTSQRDDEPVSTFLTSIEKSLDIFSTSVSVTVDPPSLVVALAEKEKGNPARPLTSDEKAGLTSILGWSGKASSGNAMSGTMWFVRHQEISFLFSEHVPRVRLSHQSSVSETPSVSSVGLAQPSSSSHFSSCGRPHWVTYHYYSHRRGADESLGDVITDLCTNSGKPCATPGCGFKSGQHQRRFIHGGLRIVMDVNTREGGEAKDAEGIQLWLGCKVCDNKTTPSQMNDGTYLFSFAKFLETLVYSPAIFNISPALCEHTTPPPRPWSPTDVPLPKSRLNIVRYFSYRSLVISFSLSVIEDIFELRVPRLQIIHSDQEKASERPSLAAQGQTTDANDEKRTLRREMVSWWQGVAEYIDSLEEVFVDDKASLEKALPRLPSVYDESELCNPALSEAHVPSIPPSTVGPKSPENPPVNSAVTNVNDQSKSKSSSVATPTPKKESDPARLLSSLRHAFQRSEQAQYTQLANTPIGSLNDVRWAFRSAARGATRRIAAWEKKHLPGKINSGIFKEKVAGKEPQWWDAGYHAVPGGNVIVREGDWGSIIAFTLSSVDFRNELAKMSQASSAPHSQLSSSTFTNPPSLFTLATPPSKPFVSGTAPQPDPDQDESWQVPEPYSAVICRKQHPRDPTSLLSLRDVLRHRSPLESSNGSTQPSSILSGLIRTPSRTAESKPPVASQPAAEATSQATNEEISGRPEGADSTDKSLHHAEAELTDPPGTTRPSLSDNATSTAEVVDAPTEHGKAASSISAASETTVRPPTPPPKDLLKKGVTDYFTSTHSALRTGATVSSFTSSLTNGLTNAMRYVLHTGDSGNNDNQTLLSVNPKIDEQPHIKYDWTIGKQLKFSCTVYYAKEFDLLRRRCGVDDAFLKSLSRSANWTADGGKSKSNFWKTWDNRFIIKTLVNAWNVADLQVLNDLGPSYFRYMDSTAGKPTVLAKLLGFYTVEIRNLESGTVQSKADLLVMENLFYEQKVVKTFDLKGIQGRKVKANSNVNGTQQSSKTLFDGEWIEGQQRTLMLVRPHSKVVLREAIKTDSDFLSKSNIMDYSLLLGVDEEHKQIACGLVDTIGSYTFAKTLEYKAKQGLNSGKDVTVIPPAEYQERFVSAIDRYFLACPDKWSSSLHGSNIDSDHLPSVL